MSFRPLGGYFDFPMEKLPEDPHLGLDFDYEYACKYMGEQMSLIIQSWVIDYTGNIFSRKATYLISRTNEVECITKHIRDHIVAMGLEDMSCRRLMRYFEVDTFKSISYESLIFNFPQPKL